MHELDDIAQVFKALSDPLRLRILKLLKRHDSCREFSVCGLAEEIGISQPNVSHHLGILKAAKLIKCEKCEGFSYYVVNLDKFKEVIQSFYDEV